MRIAITGAGGFVGAAVLRAAAAARHESVALTRSSAPVAHANVTVAYAGLHDRGGLERAFSGADAVVHLAARVHVMRSEGAAGDARFDAVNVEGTRSVLDAALACGVRRLVVLSTAKVHGEGASVPYRETDPLDAHGGYARSKAQSETLVSAVDPSRLGWTILRPPLVYGPGVGGNFRRLLQLAALGARLPLPLGGLHNRRSLVAVHNLASAILHSIGHPDAIGRAFLVSDDEDLSTTDLLRRLGVAAGRPVRLVSVPPRLMRVALGLVGRRAEAERLFESFAIDSRAIRHSLGWRPPLTVDAALSEVATWWRTRTPTPARQLTPGHADA